MSLRLAVVVLALIMPALLFDLALAFKVPNALSDGFYQFDQLLFDGGDFLIAICLPLLGLVLCGLAWIRSKARSLAVLAIITGIVLLGNVTGYVVSDAKLEAIGKSIYGR